MSDSKIKIEDVILFTSIVAGIGLIYFVREEYKDYKRENANEETLNASGSAKVKNILFVGDSITAGAPNFSYSYVIKNTLKDKTVDVVAKISMKTDWMLTNLKAQLAKKHYDKVYIYGGINDMFLATSEAAATKNANSNIQQMVNLVKAQGGQAYVITGYDASKFILDANLPSNNKYFTKNQLIAGKNRYINFQKQLAKNISGATIIPPIYISPQRAMAGGGGTHPDGIAQKEIANKVLSTITA